jgi:Uncharacterized protein conserved in bacteria (DUF2141)
MIRKIVLICILLCFGGLSSYAEDKFSVSGELSFLRDGDIYIGLYTRDEWKDRGVKSPNSYLCLKPDPEHKKASKVPFKFDGIAGGTYAIYAFQDLNGNKIQDRRLGVFSLEPSATYKHTTTAEWDAVRFDVKENMGGIWFVLMSPEGTR